ncbi:hypothetical protein BGW80DRAFT_1469404 [Lactifluus volemus]|nr:hypothetical protein BGW80DRAFT_1469404 [Lactifluus volemus]
MGRAARITVTVRTDFATNPSKYAKAIDNYITNMLKKQYRAVNERISKTGAGLKPEDVTPGSEIANLIEQEILNFKWWPRLHGYWCTLPNFNPYTVSSDLGQDLANAALSVLMGGHGDLGSDEGEFSSMCTTLWSSPDHDDVIALVSSTPAHSHHDPPAHEPSTSTASSSRVKTEAMSKVPSSTQKSRAMTKCTFQDVFAEESAKENQMLEHLGTQKHKQALGEQELKRCKLEHKTMEKQHQRERERKQHEFCMMQMQMMMSQNSQAAPTAIQSQNQPSFETFGLMAELNDAILLSGSSYST